MARLAMHLGDIAFEDRRIPFAEWAEIKSDMPFGGIPLLEVDGQRVSQSNGINRYVGKLAGLYPTDPWQAVLCDEAMDVVEDASHAIIPTFSITDEAEKKAAREKLADGTLKFLLTRLQWVLEARKSDYFADNRLTIADLKVFVWVRHIKSGRLDYVPTDLPDRVAPLIVALFNRVNDNPKIKAYYASKGGY